MKPSHLSVGLALLAMTLLPASAHAGPDDSRPVSTARPGYSFRVDTMTSLGGTYSAGTSINDRPWVAGFSTLPGGAVQHATLWRKGAPQDLGTLGGPNSSVAWPVKANWGDQRYRRNRQAGPAG